MSELADDLKAQNPEAGNVRVWINGEDQTHLIRGVQIALNTKEVPQGVVARIQMAVIIEQDFAEWTPALRAMVAQAAINTMRSNGVQH